MAQRLPQSATDQNMAKQEDLTGFTASQSAPSFSCAMAANDLNKKVGHSILSSDEKDAKGFVKKADSYVASGCAVPQDDPNLNVFKQAQLKESGFSQDVVNKAAPPKP